MQIDLRINGSDQSVMIKPHESLREVLRRIGFTGVKKGCDVGGCGACTVLLNGDPIYSCCVFAAWAQGKDITTIEGLATGGELQLIQQEFATRNAAQCGFCTPGLIMSAKALLEKKQNLTEEEIRRGIAGNLCRCTGYVKVVDAIASASKK
ncbi:MAG TPA: (2Fe-2S)-binding protein [Candidatus Acidoferrum sp.]|nr:(2Fe-2S)-binding protein [Candidatus Acidoferrum sp.]